VSTIADAAPTARLKTRYLEEIRPALVGRFGYSSVMQAPRVEKVTLNMGVGLAKQDSKVLKAAREQLATIAGQQPSVRRARKSIAAFKLREGMPVGVSVTLRSERGYEFLDRLVSIAIPRIRDFRGLNPRSFDGRGNYSMGVREQIIFPEIDYDAIDQVRGLDITITTTAATDVEAFALLSAMGLPFAAQGRPAGFDVDVPEAAEESDQPSDAPAPAKRRKTTRKKSDDAPDAEQATAETADAAAEAPTAEEDAADAATAEQAEAPAADEAEAPAAEDAEAPKADEAEAPAAEDAEAPKAEEAEAPAAEESGAPEAEEADTPTAEQGEAPAAEQQEPAPAGDDEPADNEDADTAAKESTD
jgi:large subunit ribosomal protein L5